MKPDEKGFSIADVVEIAIENAKKEGHLANGVMPKLYTDNGLLLPEDVQGCSP